MPRNAKPKKPNSRSGPRTPPGKKQMLVILDAMLIRDLKVAMAEDGTAASHVIEELARKWLVTRKQQRAETSGHIRICDYYRRRAAEPSPL